VMAWVRQYSASNAVGDRKLKALTLYAINPLLNKTPSLFGTRKLKAFVFFENEFGSADVVRVSFVCIF